MTERRTPHGKWAAGAVVILIALAFAVLVRPVPPPPKPPEAAEETAAPPLSPPDPRAGRVVCGFCNGDGRIDPADPRREAPRLDVKEGPCLARAGKGGR